MIKRRLLGIFLFFTPILVIMGALVYMLGDKWYAPFLFIGLIILTFVVAIAIVASMLKGWELLRK